MLLLFPLAARPASDTGLVFAEADAEMAPEDGDSDPGAAATVPSASDDVDVDDAPPAAPAAADDADDADEEETPGAPSNALSRRKSPAASRMCENSTQNVCTSRKRSCVRNVQRRCERWGKKNKIQTHAQQ